MGNLNTVDGRAYVVLYRPWEASVVPVAICGVAFKMGDVCVVKMGEGGGDVVVFRWHSGEDFPLDKSGIITKDCKPGELVVLIVYKEWVEQAEQTGQHALAKGIEPWVDRVWTARSGR